MNILAILRERFRDALAGYPAGGGDWTEMIRPAQDARFGDYQANFAMPLGKALGRNPREVAAEIAARVKLDDLCDPPTVEGPGFINLRLRDDWLAAELERNLADERLGVPIAATPQTYVVDYSAPNVAKPMHVGHIRSTVIGDALYRTLAFLGHRVVGDNHIGDWGTQFGMILYGYKNFLDLEAYRQRPVEELGRLYRVVNRLVEYHDARHAVPEAEQQLVTLEARLAEERARDSAAPAATKGKEKDKASPLRKLETQLAQSRETLASLTRKIKDIERDPALAALAATHPGIGEAVLAETAKLHAGDAENRKLWRKFLPPCREEIDSMYARLGVKFDFALGESFYQDRLASVVEELLAQGIARESDGAIAVFNEGHEAPLLVRKQDGAFLYATTDLATIRYRMETWQPSAILYVVDHRQSLHFEQLFATARKWGYTGVELKHVSFGTVLGDDGKPFKTRAGDTVGLVSLLDEAVRRAADIVAANDEGKPEGRELDDAQRQAVAEAVGIGALKYADLSQNRTSDYVFSYDKMLAMNGNTATYMQYAYARVQSIFHKGGVDAGQLRQSAAPLTLAHPAERALALALARLPEAVEQVVADYRPNFLTSYLFELAGRYSTFFEQCQVLRADTPEVREVRLKLCDLTARTIRLGLELLGIQVVEKM